VKLILVGSGVEHPEEHDQNKVTYGSGFPRCLHVRGAQVSCFDYDRTKTAFLKRKTKVGVCVWQNESVGILLIFLNNSYFTI
jgi:hypothetical protein